MQIITSCHYNRPNLTKQMVQHLENCTGIDNYLTIFAVEPGNLEVLQIIENSKLNKLIIKNDKLKGCWTNKKFILDTAFSNTSFVIHVEDDVLLSKDALEFFEWAKHKYTTEESVFTISAYNNIINYYQDELSHVVKRNKNRFAQTAWAIWKDRYDSIKDWSGRDAEMYEKGHFKQDKYEIFPLLSRSNNIGHENGETSCAKEILLLVGPEKTYATIGLSRNATKENISFVSDKDLYIKALEEANSDNHVVIEQLLRCKKYDFDSQLVVNRLGQEYVKLDELNYKSRDNEGYRAKYYLEQWAGNTEYSQKPFMELV